MEETRPVCDIYSHDETDTTNDGNWEWMELVGVLEDSCLRVCKEAEQEYKQGKAFADTGLFHPNNLRDAVLAQYDILEQYNQMLADAQRVGKPMELFSDEYWNWLDGAVCVTMDANRPVYGQQMPTLE